MKSFEFKGDWKIDLKLPLLSTIHSNRFFQGRQKQQHLDKLKSSLIPLQIGDIEDLNPDPTPSQINTIEYFLNQESKVFKAIFDSIKNEVNPFLIEEIGHSDYWFPKLDSLDELGNTIGIREISITNLSKENFNYYCIYFDYSGDEDHGLVLVFHKDKLVEFNQEFGYEGILKDKGLNYDEFINKLLEDYDNRVQEIQQPIPKYGKFKPWQIRRNNELLKNLIKQNQNDELIKEIEEKNIDINFRYAPLNHNLADLACSSNNIEFLNYLISKNANLEKSVWKCLGEDHSEILTIIAKAGANLESLNYWYKTPLYSQIEFLGSTLKDKYYNTNSPDKLLKLNVQEEKIKENIQLLLNLGANPNSCNDKGDDYYSLLIRWRKESFIEKLGIKEIVERLIKNKN